MSKVKQQENDHYLKNFLTFLAQDIENNPTHIHPISFDLFNRAQSLVAGIDVDLDTPLCDEDE
ncbi:hypothetical protein DSM106972_084620 [Dulcicalothrix desertica PCC 7102]|uniref:Uncharacterized protein n=1 Tax=Dulcicalothrix desertica PCC 7102 TaxID=232991 RepID=A0A433UU60_9CYAN|nr:type II toxin-antitoxin system PrlF family antitoxin [Dulcicalothrix desertica]RUS97359.1 hypothetical protein DSM106972_084620 [Dulcicalothrix desertica PCC 7102]